MNNKATGLARHAARSNSLPPARNPDKIESPKNVPRPSSLGGSFTSPKGSPRAKSIGPGVLTGLRDKIDLDSPPHSPSREGNVGGAGGSLAPGGGSGISPRGVSKPPPSPGRGGTPAEQPSNKKSSKKKKEKKEDNDNPSSSKNAQRLSVSLHTDRQNVAAVVDLPIDNEEVQQRSVASARDKKSERGPLPAPGSHSQPHSDSASTIPVPARPTQRASPRSPSSISSNTNAGSATPPSPSRIADKSSARGDLPAPGSRSTPPPYTPPPTNLQLKNINPPNSPKDHIPPPPPSPREEDNFYFEDDEEPEPPAPVAAPSPPMDPEKRERMRQEALKEIVNTERDYVKDLELVCEIFLRPLKDQPKVIPASDLNILFSNWELLEGVNKEIVKSFEKDKDNVMVGATFLSVMQFLKMYKVYCANQPQALKTLETQQQENQAFASFLQNCMANPRIKGQNLFSYLIKPIQRLCKYPLLIKVLLEHTDPSHPDHKNLAKALVEVEEIVEYVNEGKRQAEKSQKMMDLALAIDGGESLCLVTPTRIIEMEQNIEVIIKKGKPQPRKCVLFNDAILLLKEGRKGNKLYNTPALMGLGEIRVVNVSDCAEYKNGIELQALQTKEVLYVLIFGSPKDKARWMRNIKAIVKQFQRRQFEEMQKADLAPASTTPPIPAPISESPPAGNNKPRKYPSGYAPAAKPEDEVKVVKNPLLKRRSSFHDGKDKQRSVIKPPATPPATPTVPPSSPAVVGGSPTAPVVRYASKPGIKI